MNRSLAATLATLSLAASCGGEAAAPSPTPDSTPGIKQTQPGSGVLQQAQDAAAARGKVGVLSERFGHVYDSSWSDMASVKELSFFGFRAVVEGGPEDCLATVSGPVSTSAVIPAGSKTTVHHSRMAAPADRDRVLKMPTKWSFECGAEAVEAARGPVTKVQVGTPIPDPHYSKLTVPLRSELTKTCRVVVFTHALDERGLALDTSTARVSVSPDRKSVVVPRSTAAAGMLKDYTQQIEGYAARVSRVDCE